MSPVRCVCPSSAPSEVDRDECKRGHGTHVCKAVVWRRHPCRRCVSVVLAVMHGHTRGLALSSVTGTCGPVLPLGCPARLLAAITSDQCLLAQARDALTTNLSLNRIRVTHPSHRLSQAASDRYPTTPSLHDQLSSMGLRRILAGGSVIHPHILHPLNRTIADCYPSDQASARMLPMRF